MTKVAVILSGCGVFDGAEIYESTLTLLALDQADVHYQCMAPNIEQMHVINHLSSQSMEGESRNVLVEAARVARGDIIDIVDANPADYDAAIVPGGFGVAKNLSDFAVKGSEMTVHPQIKNFLQAVNEAGKPVGLICIAPVICAGIFGAGTRCTIGTDESTSEAIKAMGGEPVNCAVDDIVVDEGRKIVTTPAYMLAERIRDAAQGINKLVAKVLQLAA